MQVISFLVENMAPPLLRLVNVTAPTLTGGSFRSGFGGEFTMAAFAISTAIVGVGCSYWAAWMHARLGNYRLEAKRQRSIAESAVHLRDAVLARLQQSIVILSIDLKTPINYGHGAELLSAGLAGPDGPTFAFALDALLKDGTPFDCSVQTARGCRTNVQAAPIMGHPVIFLEELSEFDGAVDYRAALEALPMPVWVRGGDVRLRWGNFAFLSAVGAGTLKEAVNSNTTLDHSEPDLVATVRDGAEILNARRYATIAGKRRALTINMSRLQDASIACSAIDVTDAVRSEAALRIAADASADLLDKMSIAVAVFGSDQRLMSNNSRYAQMWSLPQTWLDTHPTQSEILDGLRESRLLPEQHDFAAWKRQNLLAFEKGRGRKQEFWHMPGGRSLSVVAESHLQGGLFFTFEDVSKLFQLKASLHSLEAVQRATLDAFEDAVAIFDPDGRLTQHNQSFAKLWRLSDAELFDNPHFSKIAALCIARIGRDNVWDIVSAAVASDNPERFEEWGKVTRNDGRVIVLGPSRLPNGATLINFRDVTDIERFQSLLSETSHHAA